MSITLGIYDIFANLIPGVLFLYVLNEVLKFFKLSYIDINQIDKIGSLLLVAIGAYVLGLFFNTFSHRGWYAIFIHVKQDEESLEWLKKKNQDIEIRFQPKDARILFGIIQQHTPEIARSIEVLRANSIMLKNMSMAAALFAMFKILTLFWSVTIEAVVMAVGAGLMSWAFLYYSKLQFRWFHRDVFVQALNYGSSLDQVLMNSRKITIGNAEASMRDANIKARKKS